jgi:hypothetical protein
LERDAAAGPRLERQHVAHYETAQPMPAVFHDSIAAVQVVERLMRGEAATLADGDAARGWELFHFRA